MAYGEKPSINTRTTMKTEITCAALVVCALDCRAQDGSGAVGALFEAKHLVKTNLAGYALLTVNANYEYKVGTATSVGLQGGYKLPMVIQVDAIGELDGQNQTYSGEIEPQGWFINPYFRYYVGQAMKGFYLEAFGRYYDYSYLVPYEYDKNGATIHANLDGTANGLGGGLALGVQFNLAPRVYLDIHAGYGMGVGDIHLQTNDPNLDATDYQNIKMNIEEHEADADVEIFLLGNVLEGIDAGADASLAWGDIKGKTFPLVRGGVSLGFAF